MITRLPICLLKMKSIYGLTVQANKIAMTLENLGQLNCSKPVLHMMCCYIFVIMLKQHCHFLRITNTVIWKTKVMGIDHVKSYFGLKLKCPMNRVRQNHTKLLHNSCGNTKGCLRVSKLQRQQSIRCREIRSGKLCSYWYVKVLKFYKLQKWHGKISKIWWS